MRAQWFSRRKARLITGQEFLGWLFLKEYAVITRLRKITLDSNHLLQAMFNNGHQLAVAPSVVDGRRRG